MSDPDRTTLTYRLELQKSVAQGVLEAGGATFLLLIALRWFDAGTTAKALVASGGSLGLLLSPVVVSTVARIGWPAARGAMALAIGGAVLFLVMALWNWLPLYVFGAMAGMACATSAVPLMTQIYQENYPVGQRGKLYSRTVMMRIATVAAFSELGGRLLSADISRFRWMLISFALACGYGAWCLARMPSRPLANDGGSHPFRAMRFLRDDRVFRHVLICWMLMGFANLMMLPMRVEYLANERYGLSLDVQMIALLTGVIPSVARLVMSQLWGWLFDRVDFLALRILLNLGFAAGILTFFLSDSFAGLVLGAIIFGASSSGGDVAWGLWVTKFAPAARTADYMSVHTSLTGVRGVLAPLVAFHFAHRASIGALGWLAAGLIAAASLLLLPEAWRRQRVGADKPALR